MPNYLLENGNVEIDNIDIDGEINNIIIDVVVDNNDPDTDIDDVNFWID